MFTAIFKDQKIYLYEKKTQQHPELSTLGPFLISERQQQQLLFKILPIGANM